MPLEREARLEDGFSGGRAGDGPQDIQAAYAQAERNALPPGVVPEDDQGLPDFLALVREAEAQWTRVAGSAVHQRWNRTYKAFHNEHFQESKYRSRDYEQRSKIFRPKTRSAVRKDGAAVAASLFSTIDAIAISAGNEADPMQRGAAAVVQEIVNYRTDRTGGRNAIPWFKLAIGARQNAVLSGICVSKQSWKLEVKKIATEQVEEVDPETGETVAVSQDVYRAEYDRPDMTVIPPENVIIDMAADWLDPAQSAAYLIIKWPMRRYEIEKRQQDPRRPWKQLTTAQLNAGKTTQPQDSSIRSAREQGSDRLDRTNSGGGDGTWDVIWVYETYMRVGDEDWTFCSVGGQHYLTEPAPVEEVYPWNQGDRPIVIGYGSIEAHRILPMAPGESWQQLQWEINDLANLRLDTVKQIVSPVTKVKKGASVDLAEVRKRAANSILLLTNPAEDVVWDRPPELPSSAYGEMERLNVDFDDLAGQFNSGSVQTNRTLNETVGGLRLISGAANALQEFDQRVWIETWAEPAMAQFVRLIQYYEHDPIILGLCGARAKLAEKHGIDAITDDLLDQQVTVRIDIGLGVGDPEQRLRKFANASAVAATMLKDHPKFRTGEYEINIEEVMREIYGAAGYRDGGMRFLKKNEKPQQAGPPPEMQIEIEKAQAEIQDTLADAELKRARAQAEVARVGLDRVETAHDMAMARQEAARKMANDTHQRRRDAMDTGLKVADMHGRRSEAAANRRDRATERQSRQQQTMQGRQTSAPAPAPQAAAPGMDGGAPGAGSNMTALLSQLVAAMSAPRQRKIIPQRGPDGRMSGALIQFTDGGPGPQAQLARFQRGSDGAIAGVDVTDIDPRQGR